jgi:hypothetical protein
LPKTPCLTWHGYNAISYVLRSVWLIGVSIVLLLHEPQESRLTQQHSLKFRKVEQVTPRILEGAMININTFPGSVIGAVISSIGMVIIQREAALHATVN